MTAIVEREVGATGLRITTLGLGGAPLGDFSELIPEDRAAATVEAAWAEGIRYFDTAPLYGHGLSEHRFGHFLRRQPRDSFVLSTKVGRLLYPERPERIDRGWFNGGLNFAVAYDYSYDGTFRSIEHSLARLGMPRVDIALIHDVDFRTHGSAEAYEARFREAMGGAYRALSEMRRAGAVTAIGVGVNEVEPCLRFSREGDFDCFLLAGRYTLLEQNGLDDLLPEAERKRFSILLGGPYNSGILATGAVPGARYNYAPAPPAIMDRVARIEAICRRHNIPLAAAAIQFPLGHARVASIVPGAVSPREVAANVALMQVRIPARVWEDLRNDGLLDPAATVPDDPR
jgi:D-threo-aldose 1-dehydrogenase